MKPIGHFVRATRTIVCLLLTVFGVQLVSAAADAKAHLEQVVIVFKTHFDIGYTDLASNVVKRYRTTMIDDALKVVDQNRALPPEQQFVWTLPGWPLSKIMEDWPGQTPERQQRIQQAFKEGRFAVHALPFTLHTELLEPEDIVRGLGFASRLSRAAGLALPRDAKMTDVPCHSWILPTLLKHAGVDFLHLGCNAASSSPRVPRLFFWEGPDGSRLLTMYTAESYGTGLVPPGDWPYKTWLALVMTGDNHGPPRPDEVKKLLDEAKQKLPGVNVRIGRLSDFADGILAEINGRQGAPNSTIRNPQSAIPIVRGDMPDTWIHGPMSNPQGAKLARHIRPEIFVAEALNRLLRGWGVNEPDAAPTINRAYEQSLLYGEHTWGGAQYWVTKYGAGTKWGYGEKWAADRANGRFKRLEASWAEHTAYIEKARDLIAPLLHRELPVLADSVRASGPRVVVFNPLPWKRDGLVRFSSGKTTATALAPAEGGPAVAAENVQGESQFVARDVPAFGYRTFVPVKAELGPSPFRFNQAVGTVENEFFRVTLPNDGCGIPSLVDKRSGRELVDKAAREHLGQYLYQRFTSNQVASYVKAYVKINADWAVNELGKPSMPAVDQRPPSLTTPGPAEKAAVSGVEFPNRATPSVTVKVLPTLDKNLPHRVMLRLTLYDGLPFADLEIEIIQKPADPWPEAGWLCLPFKIDSPQFRLGRLASIVDPVKDIVRGANRNLFGINTGVAIFDPQGRGVGFCAIDDPLVSLDEPGCWKYLLDFVPRKPVAYINLFNNQWTTNFRMWNEGSWTARVRLWSFDDYDGESSLITPSLEARYPLQAAVADGPGGKLPPTREGLSVSRKGILVTAFGSNPDGSGTVLRLWELAGHSGECVVRLPADLNTKSVQPVNLRGQKQGQPLTVRNDSFTINLGAFAPASFVLQP